tara:strand:+ start:60 stop:557 length:498 start_codon:yes stop_codon:yes gene_type:complete
MSIFSKIKKAKEAAEKYKKTITNKRNAKGNATNYFTPLSPNQKKPPTKDQQIVKNQKINTRIQDIAIGTALVATVTAMSKDKKLENKANTAYSNDANTFTFNKKKYKTPTKAVLNKVSSKPPVPKARPKVDKKETPTKKQLMMKEGKTKKDSNVKFNSEVKKRKK